MKTSPGVREHFLHFDNGFSTEVMDYATNTALSHSKYMIVRTEKKQQFGYCTHCNTESPTHLPKLTKRELDDREMCGCPAAMYVGEEFEKKKHGDKVICPKCKSECIVRYAGLGHSKLSDYAYFVYYEKSKLNPKMIVARCISASRDYSESYKNIKTKLETEVYYTFEYKKMGKMIKPISSSWTEPCHLGFSKTVYSMESQHPYTAFCYSRNSIEKAVKGTPFAWSGWENYDYHDMVEFFDLFSRYPLVEYLSKLGHKEIVEEKIKTGSISNGVINWNAKTIEGIFRLTKEEYAEVKQNKIFLNSSILNLLKENKERNLKLSIPEVAKLSTIVRYDSELESLLKTFKKYLSFRDAFKYCIKQKNKNPSTYSSAYSIIRDWEDYVSECKKLNMDITDMRVLFPNDLHKAHQNTTDQINYEADKALTEKIILRLPDLSYLNFSLNGFLIRPAESAFEIVGEGRHLHHCVGRYSKDYAEGKTCILFIRKIDHPDESFFTVEVQNNSIVQVRGYKNNDPTDENLLDFIERFKKHLLKFKKTSNKKLNKVPA